VDAELEKLMLHWKVDAALEKWLLCRKSGCCVGKVDAAFGKVDVALEKWMLHWKSGC
jgi:hypothetical protein